MGACSLVMVRIFDDNTVLSLDQRGTVGVCNAMYVGL